MSDNPSFLYTNFLEALIIVLSIGLLGNNSLTILLKLPFFVLRVSLNSVNCLYLATKCCLFLLFNSSKLFSFNKF